MDGRDDRCEWEWPLNLLRVVHRRSAAVAPVGYDNTWFARLHRLSLTTIDGHITEVGHVAGRTLTARIDGERGTPGVRLLFPDLVERSSTGPAPA